MLAVQCYDTAILNAKEFEMLFMSNDIVLAFGLPGNSEWIIILIIALLIFGRRLPEVARNIGKSLTQFKKGITDAADEIKKMPDDDDDSPKASDKSDTDV